MVFNMLFKALFGPPNRPLGPTWVHFRVLFTPNCCLFRDMALFGKYAFRLDETIVFEVLGGLISVLFCNISQYPFQCHTFRNISRLFGSQGWICGPKGVSLGSPGASFWSYFVDAVPGWGPVCAVGAKK